jgi:hypothetical protein
MNTVAESYQHTLGGMGPIPTHYHSGGNGAKQAKQDDLDHWSENDNVKLIPKPGWQEFTASIFKDVYQFSGCVRTFCSGAVKGGRISCLKGKFKTEFTLLDLNSLFHFAMTHIRIPTTEPLVLSIKMDELPNGVNETILKDAIQFIIEINITSLKSKKHIL